MEFFVGLDLIILSSKSFKLLCEKLGVSPSQCVMVGDSKNDIVAAKAANIKSIGLTYGYNYGESIAKYKPNWVFDDFEEILTLAS